MWNCLISEMVILGIETSCDETGVAIIKGSSSKNKVSIVSNSLVSSLPIHSKTGGIIPENAAREQVKYMIPVLESALKQAFGSKMAIDKWKMENLKIDAIAVTVGPGLIGSLLVGVETAKTLAYLFKKPIIPVNHLIGHIYANWIMENGKWKMENILFPLVALVVSGGHTDLVLLRNHGSIKWLGGTRDDAAGEAFDKIGRLLNLPYPGGPSIEKAALKGKSEKFNFPKPLIDSPDFDFSFSGLKTSVFNKVKEIGELDNQVVSDISAGTQEAVVDVLVTKTLRAAKNFKAKSILLGGGVAANQKLRDDLKWKMENGKWKINLFVPTKSLCTDNAAMIASAAFYNYKELPWQKISANPELYFD